VSLRVVLCDDHRLYADSIAMALRSRGVDVVAVTNTPAECLEVLEGVAAEIDVLVLDWSIGPETAVELIAAVSVRSPELPVLVVSGSPEPDVPHRARSAGAAAFASKELGVDHLVRIIERVHRGESVDERGSARRSAGVAALARQITPKERQVLELLVEGKDTAVLARELDISYATARTHIQNLLTKLGAHSKLELVSMTVTHRLVPPPTCR
jgi:two-component system, NarL family, nitrate/nitrite response regulator NarL